MQRLTPLTPDSCLEIVVRCAPLSSKVNPAINPADQMLSDLGVKGKLPEAIFIAKVTKAVAPWFIDDENIPTGQGTDLQTCANAIMANAFKIQAKAFKASLKVVRQRV
jgi:hypothetical protein